MIRSLRSVTNWFHFLKTAVLLVQNNNPSFPSKLCGVGMCGQKDTNEIFVYWCYPVWSLKDKRRTSSLFLAEQPFIQHTGIARIFVRTLSS